MSIKKLYFKKTSCFIATAFLVLLMSSFQLNAQKTTVKGTVIDESGVTLPGVNVLEEGTSNSTSTDLQGKYTINVTSQKSKLTQR